MLHRLLVLGAILAACAAAGLGPMPATAAVTTTPRPAPAQVQTGPAVQLQGFGARGFRSRRPYGSPYRTSPYRRTYRRSRGRGFLHGLFWGWMLSHFFGGGYGIPLVFPFLLLVLVLVAMRPRRRRPMYW